MLTQFAVSQCLFIPEETEKGQSALSQYREQATLSGATAARLTEENGRLAAERDDLKRQVYNAK